MKDFILLVLQIVVIACIIGALFSLINRLFGYSLGLKGNEVPADFRATALFVGLGAFCGAIVYFWGRHDDDNHHHRNR